MKISENSIDPDTLFNLSVIEEGNEVETLEDMSMIEISDKYIENSGSSYLEIEIRNRLAKIRDLYIDRQRYNRCRLHRKCCEHNRTSRVR